MVEQPINESKLKAASVLLLPSNDLIDLTATGRNERTASCCWLRERSMQLSCESRRAWGRSFTLIAHIYDCEWCLSRSCFDMVIWASPWTSMQLAHMSLRVCCLRGAVEGTGMVSCVS